MSTQAVYQDREFSPAEQKGYEHCKRFMFPMLKRLKLIVDETKERLANGEKLEDIHADQRRRRIDFNSPLLPMGSK